MNLTHFKEQVFKISTPSEFEDMAIKLFNYQVESNSFYKKYCAHLGINKKTITSITNIPFLPIGFFKTEKILCKNTSYQTCFNSSGTTSSKKSKHYIESLAFYEKTLKASFERFWGDINSYRFFCLTPEKKDAPKSSLIHMCDFFVQQTKNLGSGFYLNELEKLTEDIKISQEKNQPFILIGLSFSILEFSRKYKINLSNGHVIETGGMKNQTREIIKEVMYNTLKVNFQTNSIQSEYGMTELLSQSYSLKNEEFESPPWKKVLIRDKYNPLAINNKSSGGINIIDLANIHSCAFIATDDFGVIKNNRFKVLGRLKNASIRGCASMI